MPKTPNELELLNWVVQIAYDVALYILAGQSFMPFLYLLLSDLFGLGSSPLAGHFIAEHYTFHPEEENLPTHFEYQGHKIRRAGPETMSYTGPLNFWSFSVGYHVEHHDLPNVPGSNLFALRTMAPELYENEKVHSSWTKVILDYIFTPGMGPFSRVKRHTLDDDEVTRLRAA
jgi:sphingolipid delta-4 desaturase